MMYYAFMSTNFSYHRWVGIQLTCCRSVSHTFEGDHLNFFEEIAINRASLIEDAGFSYPQLLDGLCTHDK